MPQRVRGPPRWQRVAEQLGDVPRRQVRAQAVGEGPAIAQALQLAQQRRLNDRHAAHLAALAVHAQRVPDQVEPMHARYLSRAQPAERRELGHEPHPPVIAHQLAHQVLRRGPWAPLGHPHRL